MLAFVFVALALAAIVFFAWALRNSVQHWQDEQTVDATIDARGLLKLREKQLLQQLRELEFERNSEKLSEDDYQTIKQKIRHEIKTTMHELDDQISDHWEDANKLVEDALRAES